MADAAPAHRRPGHHAPPDTGTETTTYLLNQAGAFLGDHGQVGPERVSRHEQLKPVTIEALLARSDLEAGIEALLRGWPGRDTGTIAYSTVAYSPRRTVPGSSRSVP